MKVSVLASVGATVLAGTVSAADSICDKYTTALFKDNTGANQYTLLVKLVNTALIGNYTPGAKNAVNGILRAGDYMGTSVNLLPYFNGGLDSSNRGGSSGVSVNFLDGGGAIPVSQDKPADDTTSNQYMLLTHLYEFFGALLGCSQYGSSSFPSYQGESSMYQVHKFMYLDAAQNGYFIEQVALSAASFGVTADDLKAAGTALNSLFNERCAPAAAVLPSSTPELQAICIAPDCTEAPTPNCTAYASASSPSAASSTPGPGESAVAGQLSMISASASAAAMSTAMPTMNSTGVVTPMPSPTYQSGAYLTLPNSILALVGVVAAFVAL